MGFMMSKMKLLLIVFCLFYVTPALAYLDPGSGSLLLQIILGGIAGLAVAGKLFWYRIKRLFGFKPDLDEEDIYTKPAGKNEHE